MFHRILIEEWQRGFSLAAFLIFFSVFLVAVFRACRKSRQTRAHLKNLPLTND